MNHIEQEIDEINNILCSVGVVMKEYPYFSFGQFVQYPNYRGYFKRDEY